MVGNARSLAKLGAFMANGGAFGGKTLISPETWDTIHKDPKLGRMGGFSNTDFTQGGFNAHNYFHDSAANEMLHQADEQIAKGREGFYGWMGVGGSVFQWNPELKISFAYVTFDLMFLDDNDTKAKSLQVAVKNCVSGKIPVEVVGGKAFCC